MKALIADFLLPAVPVPLVDLLEGDIEAVGQVLHILGRPVGIALEALLEVLALLVCQAISWHLPLLICLDTARLWS